jgi:riboflavin synthase
LKNRGAGKDFFHFFQIFLNGKMGAIVAAKSPFLAFYRIDRPLPRKKFGIFRGNFVGRVWSAGTYPRTPNGCLDIRGRSSYAYSVFTGLIEEIGRMLWIRATERGTALQIAAPQLADGVRIGDSIAVNGCCLTVSAHRPGQLTFDLLNETLEHTNLKTLRRDALLNLERALRANGRLGGHFVQGHVDCTSRVISFEQNGDDYRLEVALSPEFGQYATYKGSIAVNGVSLTIAEILPQSFAVWIIPQTRHHTNIGALKLGDLVNLEFDILAKYVERMLPKETLNH